MVSPSRPSSDNQTVQTPSGVSLVSEEDEDTVPYGDDSEPWNVVPTETNSSMHSQDAQQRTFQHYDVTENAIGGQTPELCSRFHSVNEDFAIQANKVLPDKGLDQTDLGSETLSLGDELNLDQTCVAAETTRKESEFLSDEVCVERSCKRKRLEQNGNTLKKTRSEGCVQENTGYDYRCIVKIMGFPLMCHLTLLNREDLGRFAEALKYVESDAEPEENYRYENSEGISTGNDALGQLSRRSSIVQERNQEPAMQQADCPQVSINNTTEQASDRREKVFDDTSDTSVSQFRYSDISDVDEDMTDGSTPNSCQTAQLRGCHVDNPPPPLHCSKEKINKQAKGKSGQNPRKGKKNRKIYEKVLRERGLSESQAPVIRNKETPLKDNDKTKTVGSHKLTAANIAAHMRSQLEKPQATENMLEASIVTENTFKTKVKRENGQEKGTEDCEKPKNLPDLSKLSEYSEESSKPPDINHEALMQKLKQILQKKGHQANNPIHEQCSSLKIVKIEPVDRDFNEGTVDYYTTGAAVNPDATVATTMDPDASVATTLDPDATMAITVNSDATMAPTMDPDATVVTTMDPDATVAPTMDPDATVAPTMDPDATMAISVNPDATVGPDAIIDPDATLMYGFDGPGGKIL